MFAYELVDNTDGACVFAPLDERVQTETGSLSAADEAPEGWQPSKRLPSMAMDLGVLMGAFIMMLLFQFEGNECT